MNHQPSRRLRLTTSWWIAGELVRRHPHLRLIETHPAGGTYDILSLRDRHAGEGSVCDINRIEGGRIHVLGQSTGILSWTEVLALDDPHEAIRRVEAAAGLRAPERTPSSGRAALAFRVISRFLDALLHERHPWDARNAFLDTSGYESTRRSLARFPLAEAAATPHGDDLFGEPYYRFWILTRSGEARAVIDTEANLYTSSRVIDLSERYALARCSLNRVTGEVIDLVASDG